MTCRTSNFLSSTTSHAFRRLWLLLALPALAAGCDGDEAPMEPDNSPPNLSGTYTLVSINAIVTGGVTATPPDVSGTFTLTQTAVAGQEATGTLSMSLTLPDGLGGTADLVDEGTYISRTDGTWEQMGALVQAKGTYALVGNMLTVEATEPAINASTTVWRRE